MLRAIPVEELWVTVLVDGELYRENLPLGELIGEGPSGSATLELVDFPEGEAGQATIGIVFLYAPVGAEPIPLAETEQALRWGATEPALALDALGYRYLDNNDNGIFDFYEVSSGPGDVVPVSVVLGLYPFASLDIDIELLAPDRETAMRVLALAEEGQLRVYFEPIEGWPWGVNLNELLEEREAWHVHPLTPERAYDCDGWEEGVHAVSAFESSLSQPAMGVFERPRLVPNQVDLLLVPIGGGVPIEDLAVFLRELGARFPSRLTPLNDSLGYVLVPENTWGWLRVWDRAGMAGVPDNPSCTFNLTSPPILEGR